MSDTMYVKPAEGVRVRREESPRDYVASEGMDVPRTAYYMRRVRDGSLVKCDPPKKAEKSKTTSKKE